MNEKEWVAFANQLLKGRTIKAVRYMSETEAEERMWNSRPVVIELDNGVVIIPQSDDEGNDAGALQVGDELLPVL